MRNIFLLYMPPGNPEAMIHYEDTIKKRVSLDTLVPHMRREEVDELLRIFGNHRVAVWGSRGTSANHSKFDKMSVGDDVLIVEGPSIKLMGKIALKTENAKLARFLWKNLQEQNSDETWDLVYFIANPVELDVPFEELCRLFSYSLDYQLRGFTTVASDKRDAFFAKYEDLYSVLLRLKSGDKIVTREAVSDATRVVKEPVDLGREDLEESSNPQIVSQHTDIQRRLAVLGHKAGDQVWIPNPDKGRVQRLDPALKLEEKLVTGIDLPKSYIENIDVIWKDEFRIDAAYEVENSTAIYSGLLRFADLTIRAPNSLYPMFIVAPEERRNRVREQLSRPVFRKLDLPSRVRFLPYSRLREVEDFYSKDDAGLTVQVIVNKSERFAVD